MSRHHRRPLTLAVLVLAVACPVSSPPAIAAGPSLGTRLSSAAAPTAPAVPGDEARRLVAAVDGLFEYVAMLPADAAAALVLQRMAILPARLGCDPSTAGDLDQGMRALADHVTAAASADDLAGLRARMRTRCIDAAFTRAPVATFLTTLATDARTTAAAIPAARLAD